MLKQKCQFLKGIKNSNCFVTINAYKAELSTNKTKNVGILTIKFAKTGGIPINQVALLYFPIETIFSVADNNS